MKTYYTHLEEAKAKLELSKLEKVELGLVDDLKDLLIDAKRIIALQDDGLKWLGKAEANYKEYKKVWNDAEGINRGADKQADKLLDELEKAVAKTGKAADDLGVNSKDIPQYVKGLKQLGEIRENRGRYQDIKKDLDKIK